MGNKRSRKFKKRVESYYESKYRRPYRMSLLNKKEERDFQLRVHDYIRRMADYLGIEIPDKDLPIIAIYDKKRGKENISNENVACYSLPLNYISIPQDEINSGDSLGEEIGHFLRDFTVPKNQRYPDEKSVQEFFGYLGRRVLQKVTNSNENLTFDEMGYYQDVASLKDNLNFYHSMAERWDKEASNLEKPRTKFKKFLDRLILGELDSPENRKTLIDSAKALAQGARKNRKGSLDHYRGYYLATKVDLDKLNLKEIYSLPQDEVTKRFFGKDKKYTLEGKLSLGLIISLSAFVLTTENTITGNAIAGEIIPLSKPLSFITLGIALICAGLLVYRRLYKD